MNKVICDQCETVSHCLKHGCIPITQAAPKTKQANGTPGADAEDAARYRWLRDGHKKGLLRKTRRPSDAPYVINPRKSVLYGVVSYDGADLDKAIDEDRLDDLAQYFYEEALIEGDSRFSDPSFRFSDEFAEECMERARQQLE